MSAALSIRIATRQSKLALWQAEHVAALLRAHHPSAHIQLVPMSTQGDKILDTPLARIGGKGLFIKELEIAMQNDEADLAVHSMKDVGTNFPEGFGIAAILPREDPSDAFVSNHYERLEELPQGAIVGTCSLRRRMQLSHYRPDLQLRDLRGNVQTRLNKLDEEQFDAIILASAGLKRLQLENRIRTSLPFTLSLPAIGQGAIGIECPLNSPIYPLLQALNDHETALCVHTERIINERLQGSCQVPLAAFAQLHDNNIHLQARLGYPDGSKMLSFNDIAPINQAHELGNRAADSLLSQGAQHILDSLSHAPPH